MGVSHPRQIVYVQPDGTAATVSVIIQPGESEGEAIVRVASQLGLTDYDVVRQDTIAALCKGFQTVPSQPVMKIAIDGVTVLKGDPGKDGTTVLAMNSITDAATNNTTTVSPLASITGSQLNATNQALNVLASKLNTLFAQMKAQGTMKAG